MNKAVVTTLLSNFILKVLALPKNPRTREVTTGQCARSDKNLL